VKSSNVTLADGLEIFPVRFDWSEAWRYDIIGRCSEGGTDRLLFCAAVFPEPIVVDRAVLKDMTGVVGGVECCDMLVAAAGSVGSIKRGDTYPDPGACSGESASCGDNAGSVFAS
jgi:hypothetical protein